MFTATGEISDSYTIASVRNSNLETMQSADFQSNSNVYIATIAFRTRSSCSVSNVESHNSTVVDLATSGQWPSCGGFRLRLVSAHVLGI